MHKLADILSPKPKTQPQPAGMADSLRLRSGDYVRPPQQPDPWIDWNYQREGPLAWLYPRTWPGAVKRQLQTMRNAINASGDVAGGAFGLTLLPLAGGAHGLYTAARGQPIEPVATGYTAAGENFLAQLRAGLKDFGNAGYNAKGPTYGDKLVRDFTAEASPQLRLPLTLRPSAQGLLQNSATTLTGLHSLRYVPTALRAVQLLDSPQVATVWNTARTLLPAAYGYSTVADAMLRHPEAMLAPLRHAITPPSVSQLSGLLHNRLPVTALPVTAEALVKNWQATSPQVPSPLQNYLQQVPRQSLAPKPAAVTRGAMSTAIRATMSRPQSAGNATNSALFRGAAAAKPVPAAAR